VSTPTRNSVSIGFTSSILFDEQKRPYDTAIRPTRWTQGSFKVFDAFYWALSLLDTANTATQQQQIIIDRNRLQEGTLEFIEAWLALEQKLVNTMNMLKTRYALQAPSAYQQSLANNDIRKV
jgi:hypothetical protein